MRYLENLPAELLELISSHLRRPEWITLRATSKTFGFLREHIFQTMYFNGGFQDAKKLRDVLRRGGFRDLLRRCVFDITSENFIVFRLLDNIAQEQQIMRCLSKSYPKIKEIRIISHSEATMFMLEMIHHVQILSLQRLSLKWMPDLRKRLVDENKDVIRSHSPFMICSQLKYSDISSLNYMAGRYDGFRFMNLEDLHIYCNEDIPFPSTHTWSYDSLAPSVALPRGLRRLILSCCHITRSWFANEVLCLPRIERVALLCVNIVSSMYSIGTQAEDPPRPAKYWQEIAEMFDEKYEDSSEEKRLFIGQAQENWTKVSINDTCLLTLTLLSNGETLYLRRCLDDICGNIWETLESF